MIWDEIAYDLGHNMLMAADNPQLFGPVIVFGAVIRKYWQLAVACILTAIAVHIYMSFAYAKEMPPEVYTVAAQSGVIAFRIVAALLWGSAVWLIARWWRARRARQTATDTSPADS